MLAEDLKKSLILAVFSLPWSLLTFNKKIKDFQNDLNFYFEIQGLSRRVRTLYLANRNEPKQTALAKHVENLCKSNRKPCGADLWPRARNRRTSLVNWQNVIFTSQHLIIWKVGGRGSLKKFLQALLPLPAFVPLAFCPRSPAFFALPHLPRAWNRLLEPRPFDPVSSALTIRPPRLPAQTLFWPAWFARFGKILSNT